MAAASWSARADVETPALLAFEVSPDTREDPDDSTKQNVREIVSATYEWAGMDSDTMLWHVAMYRGSKVAIATAANSGIALRTRNAPTEGASMLHVDGFANDASALLQGWKLMVWGDPTIYTLTSDGIGSTVSVLTQNAPLPAAAEVDNITGKVYLAAIDGLDKVILRMDLDGSNSSIIYTGGSQFHYGITHWYTDNYIYFTQHNGKIKRADLDGGSPSDLVTGLNDLYDIVATSSYLYFGTQTGKLQRCDRANGANVTTLVSGLGGENGYGIQVDTTNSKIYYTNPTDRKIYKCDLDGSNNATVLETSATATYGPTGLIIDVENDVMYYTIHASGTASEIGIYRHALDGTGDSTMIYDVGDEGCWGLAIDDDGYLYNTSFSAEFRYFRKVHKSGVGAILEISPTVTAATAALGDNAPVYFFKPTSVSGARTSKDGTLHTVTADMEFATAYQDVDQPEEA